MDEKVLLQMLQFQNHPRYCGIILTGDHREVAKRIARMYAQFDGFVWEPSQQAFRFFNSARLFVHDLPKTSPEAHRYAGLAFQRVAFVGNPDGEVVSILRQLIRSERADDQITHQLWINDHDLLAPVPPSPVEEDQDDSTA